MFPFNLWMTCMEVGFEGVKLAVRFSEMAFDSHAVIGVRTGVIDAVRGTPRAGQFPIIDP